MHMNLQIRRTSGKQTVRFATSIAVEISRIYHLTHASGSRALPEIIPQIMILVGVAEIIYHLTISAMQEYVGKVYGTNHKDSHAE